MSNFSADKDSNSKGRSQKADAHIYQHDGTKVDGVNSIGLCHWQQKRGHNQDGGIDIHKGSRSVGTLCGTRLMAVLGKECGLLVSDCSGNRNRGTKQIRRSIISRIV